MCFRLSRLLCIPLALFFVDRAGGAGFPPRGATAWFFNLSSSAGEDEHNTLRAGGTRSLRGSACCTFFTVLFPTDDTFVLREGVYEIARGTVQTRSRSRLALVPDATSLGILRWWTENEIESFWNAGVFDLGLSWRASQLVSQSIGIGMQGQRPATLKIAIRVTGAVVRVDRTRIIGNRFAPGKAKGRMTYADKLVGTSSIDGLEDAFPYPPEVPCEEGDEGSYGGPDYCYDPGSP